MKQRIPIPVPYVDLRPVTRDAKKVVSTIYVTDEVHARHLWLTCGSLTINKCREHSIVGARLANAYDFEHNSAWAFRFEAIGLTWSGDISSGWTHYTGFFHPRASEEMHIPRQPLTKWYRALPWCTEKQCKGDHAHRVVPEGLYAGPKPDAENDWLLGQRFEIHTSIRG